MDHQHRSTIPPWIRYQIMSPATRGAATSDSQATVGLLRIKRKAITPASISFLFLLHGTLATGSVFFRRTTHRTRPLPRPPREGRLHFEPTFRNRNPLAPTTWNNEIYIVIVTFLPRFVRELTRFSILQARHLVRLKSLSICIRIYRL